MRFVKHLLYAILQFRAVGKQTCHKKSPLQRVKRGCVREVRGAWREKYEQLLLMRYLLRNAALLATILQSVAKRRNNAAQGSYGNKSNLGEVASLRKLWLLLLGLLWSL